MAHTPHVRRGPARRPSQAPKRDYEFTTEPTWRQYAVAQFSRAWKILGAAAVFGSLIGAAVGYFGQAQPEPVPLASVFALGLDTDAFPSLGAWERLVSDEANGNCLVYEPLAGKPAKVCDLHGTCAVSMADDGHVLVNPSCRAKVGHAGGSLIPSFALH